MTSTRCLVLTGVFFLGLAAGAPAAERTKKVEAPASLQPRATWWETLLASREALMEQEAAAERQAEAERQADPVLRAFQPLRTEVSNQQEPRKIKLRVAGMKQLYLGCAGREQVFLGDPQLIGGDGRPTALPLAKMRVAGGRGWANNKDTGEWAQKKYSAGVLLWDKEICVELDGRAEWLEGWVGARSAKEVRHAEFSIQCRPLADIVAKAMAARQALADAVAEAFPSGADSRQQLLEAWLDLWRADWKRGDLADLAARFAGACDGPQKQAAEELAKKCRSVADLKAVRGLFYAQYTGPRLTLARKTLEMVERAAPRPQLAAELAALEKQFADSQGNSHGEALYIAACNLRRKIVLSHPGLDFTKLLINKRSGFLPEHQCLQYLGRHSEEAPGLAVLEDWKDSPRATVLLKNKLPPGATIHPDLSYDGRRVLFAFTDHSGDSDKNLRAYFIYEYSFDSGEVRQITGTAASRMVGERGRQTVLIEDTDPCYLPDGGMAFISTRCQEFGRCHAGAYKPAATLYRAELDGSKMRPLSFSEANEWFPTVLHDGSILYTRWDYMNRNPVHFQSLWVMHPDGTQAAHYYGNNGLDPCFTGEAQPIPGSRKVVATAAQHHGQTLGTLIVVDPLKGQDHGAPLTWITPELKFLESGVPQGITPVAMPLADDLYFRQQQQGRQYFNGRAATPWPVSEELFLCTYQHGGRQFAVYLVDVLGGRELIYNDPNISSFDPIPLRPRPMPPAMPSTLAGQESEKTGEIYIQDVYQCRHPLEPGSIKRVRVNELMSQPAAFSPESHAYRQELVKRVLGTVPVEADGSVAFEAPARTPLQFQLLDENGMAVMTMRSQVYLQPGERASCIGCHEPRSSVPPSTAPMKAKVRPIAPPAGPRYEGGLSFVRSVQPVLDRYCISCHGLDKVEGNVNLLGSLPGQEAQRLKEKTYSTAYNSLIASGRVKMAAAWGETVSSRPSDYYANAGTLAKMLLDGHPDKDGKKRVELDRDSLQRIVDWMDVNSQFYGDYSCNRIEWQPPLPEGEKRLREAIAKRFGAELAAQPYEALVNKALPSESRVLLAPLPVAAGGWGQIAKGAFSGKNDPAWQELLKLIEGSVTPPAHHDIAGTCGRDADCRCGGCWVRKDHATRQQTRTAGPPSSPRLSAAER